MKANKCNFKKGLVVYHISDKLYEDLRPLAFQSPTNSVLNNIENIIGKDRLDGYIHELNFFLEKPSKENIRDLVKSGFGKWSSDELYIYTVDLELIPDLVDYVTITSHPEMDKYLEDTWEEWYEEHKDLASDKYFKAKAKYTSDMAKTTGIPSKVNINDFKDLARRHLWCNMDFYVNLNIEKGATDQYASYIPHLQIYVNKPIEFLSVEKL